MSRGNLPRVPSLHAASIKKLLMHRVVANAGFCFRCLRSGRVMLLLFCFIVEIFCAVPSPSFLMLLVVAPSLSNIPGGIIQCFEKGSAHCLK